jgi:hypothetical protein
MACTTDCQECQQWACRNVIFLNLPSVGDRRDRGALCSARAWAQRPAEIGKPLMKNKKRLIEAGFWPGPRAEQVRSFLLHFWSSDPSVILRLSFGLS